MAKEISAFLRSELGNDATNSAHEARDRMLGRLAQMRFEFTEGQLDRVEVRRIFRKINQSRPRSFDGLRYAGDLVYRQIVHEHDLAALEGWDKTLLHISEKRQPVHGSLDHKRCGHSTLPQAPDKGNCLPMSVRRVADQPFATRSTAAQPHHRGVRACFVDEHQPRWVKHALLAYPAPAHACHVRALLLRCVQSFF